MIRQRNCGAGPCNLSALFCFSVHSNKVYFELGRMSLGVSLVPKSLIIVKSTIALFAASLVIV